MFRMRYIPFLILSIFLLTSCLGNGEENNFEGFQTTEEEPIDEIVKLEYGIPEEYKRYIIIFEPGPRWNKEIIEEYNGMIMNEAETIKMVSAYLPDHIIPRIKDHPRVLSVEQDQIVELEAVNWGYDQVRAGRSHHAGLTGRGVNIAVVDSGIAPHSALSIAGGASFVHYTPSFVDDNGHGTHVAGIIGAKARSHGLEGVAPDASIYALKSLDINGNGFLSDTIAAIDWSIINRMDIINLSLGMDSDSFALRNIIDKAYNNNILIVTSAGNSGNWQGTGDTVLFPAKYPSTIAVAATDHNNQRANFSSTGPAVEISAPGNNIYSTFLHNHFVTMNGTSQAAPYVSGILALLKEAFPQLNANELRQRLIDETIDLGMIGRDSWFGYGLTQAPDFFRDIRNHWALNDILQVNEFGWMRGTGNYQFSPQQNLTRAQAAVVLVRALGLKRKSNNPTNFTDINHWAKEEIEIIFQHELMVGTTATTFSPETPMTREQMAAILTRVLNLERTSEMANPFHDVREGHWATNSIVATTHHQIFRGLSSTTFGGNNIINRAQMAALMNRISTQIR